MSRAEPRLPMGKHRARAAYARALETLEPHHGSKMWGVQEHVRHLRRQCATMRTRWKEAEQRVQALTKELEEATNGRA